MCENGCVSVRMYCSSSSSVLVAAATETTNKLMIITVIYIKHLVGSGVKIPFILNHRCVPAAQLRDCAQAAVAHYLLADFVRYVLALNNIQGSSREISPILGQPNVQEVRMHTFGVTLVVFGMLSPFPKNIQLTCLCGVLASNVL